MNILNYFHFTIRDSSFKLEGKLENTHVMYLKDSCKGHNLSSILQKFIMRSSENTGFYIFKLILQLVHPHLGHPYADITNDHYKLAWRNPRFLLLGS